jgi:hypothetical protein
LYEPWKLEGRRLRGGGATPREKEEKIPILKPREGNNMSL